MSTDANMQPQYPKPSLANQTQSSLALALYRISSENKKGFEMRIKHLFESTKYNMTVTEITRSKVQSIKAYFISQNMLKFNCTLNKKKNHDDKEKEKLFSILVSLKENSGEIAGFIQICLSNVLKMLYIQTAYGPPLYE